MSDDTKLRNHYSDAFKNETVERYWSSGLAVHVFARQEGIEQSVLYRWIKRYRKPEPLAACGGAAAGGDGARSDEVAALRSEVRALRSTVETLRVIIEKTLVNRYFTDVAAGVDGGISPQLRRMG